MWDVRAATRVAASDARYLTMYSSIDTAFNHRHLYVCHPGAPARVCFDFGNPRMWLHVPIDEEAAEALRLYPATALPPFADLRPRSWGLPLESAMLEEAVEKRLEGQLRLAREAHGGLPTRMDGHLAQLLHVALASCEQERAWGSAWRGAVSPECEGVESASLLFEGLVRNVCAPDEVLRAVPVQFCHLRVSLFWPALADRPSVREVLASPPATVFAVRARIVSYPEGAVAVWVAVAAKSKAGTGR